MGKRNDIPALKPGVDIKPPGEAQPELDEATQKLYADALPRTVQIVTDLGVGSGVILDAEGKIGTAAHVILGSREQFAITSDGKRYRLEISKLDDVNDLSILSADGLQPQKQAIAEMGSSENLKPGQDLFSMGHPGGLRPAYISPGSFERSLSQGLLIFGPEQSNKDTLESLKFMPPQELPEISSILNRDLIAARVHIRPGDSGGPVFDQKGKVVGLNDMISSYENGYYVPVEKLRNLYESKDSKFDISYHRMPEAWVSELENTVRQKPATAAAMTMGAGGLAYAGYRTAAAFPRLAGLAAAAGEGDYLIKDGKNLLRSGDTADKFKYGLASAADLTGMVGGIAMLSSRLRFGGALGIAAGVGLRAASDLLPNRLVLTDIKRKSDYKLPPNDPNLEKTLGF